MKRPGLLELAGTTVVSTVLHVAGWLGVVQSWRHGPVAGAVVATGLWVLLGAPVAVTADETRRLGLRPRLPRRPSRTENLAR